MFDKAIEKHLGRRVNFKKDVILQDDGNGTYIKEWNLSEPQPTMEQLTDTYNVNKSALDLDAKIRLTPDIKLIKVNGTLHIATGYLETIEITSGEWESWRSYISNMPEHPVRLQLDDVNLPQMAQDGALGFVTKYIENQTTVNLDASASMWIFKNNNNSTNVYLPNAQGCEGRVYYIKNNATANKNVVMYPSNGQKIDTSISLSVGNSKNCTLVAVKDSANVYGWVILENP